VTFDTVCDVTLIKLTLLLKCVHFACTVCTICMLVVTADSLTQSAFLESRELIEMDIDNVLSHIGDFGRAQKKIYFLVSLTHVFLGFHTLILSFIGTDPGWKCVPGKIQGIPLKNGNVLQGTTSKCFDLEQGHCTPEYLTEYTSIVTEVK